MSADGETRAADLGGLSEQVLVLQARLDEVVARLELIERERLPATAGRDRQPAGKGTAPLPAAREEMLPGALLPRIATVCFVLVFALILRTVTDSGLIDIHLGSVIGLGYVIALILWGWRLFATNSRLAPVFPISGLLLLFSIILEAHGRFHTLSTVWAYGLLFVAGGVVTWLGLRYRARFTLCAANLGTGFTGMIIGFPYPVFPMAAVILLAANLGAALAARRDFCPSLRWTTLGLTILFWLLWTFKLSQGGGCEGLTALLIYCRWFFPLLALMLLFYIITGVMSVTAAPEVGFFDGMIPTVSAICAFIAGWAVIGAWSQQRLVLPGLIVVALGIGYQALAAWLAGRRARQGSPGSNSFTLAGVFLVAAGLGVIVDNLAWVLPLWAAGAYVLVRLSEQWNSGGVRLTSYILQVAAVAVAVLSRVFTTGVVSPRLSIIAAAIMAGVSLLHYCWARAHKPPTTQSAFFSWFDQKDVAAVCLLISGLVSGFLFFRLSFQQFLLATGVESDGVFTGGQTVLINLSAIVLMLTAVRRKSIEILLVGVAVALLGGGKVFLYDIFKIKGLPLVLGVFTFGVVAAVGSMVSGRWQSLRGGSRVKQEAA
ncbi:MAG: hypothetical protein L3J03_07275 [Desulfobacterales bacterium]|nr:hypothetical protein [Desulfobacterales bacterium]